MSLRLASAAVVAIGLPPKVQLRRRHRPLPFGQLDPGSDQKDDRGLGDAIELSLDLVADIGHAVAAGHGSDAAEKVEMSRY
jgi:hypothetical protein